MSLPLGNLQQILDFFKTGILTQLTNLPLRVFPAQGAHSNKVRAHRKHACKTTHATHLGNTLTGSQKTEGQESSGSYP